MTADMDPKPEKLQQDVILKFRNLKVISSESTERQLQPFFAVLS